MHKEQGTAAASWRMKGIRNDLGKKTPPAANYFNVNISKRTLHEIHIDNAGLWYISSSRPVRYGTRGKKKEKFDMIGNGETKKLRNQNPPTLRDAIY